MYKGPGAFFAQPQMTRSTLHVQIANIDTRRWNAACVVNGWGQRSGIQSLAKYAMIVVALAAYISAP